MRDAAHAADQPGKGRYYPPTGTYPSPQEAPASSGLPPPVPAPAEKPRRVGTFTMALCLIAAGAVLLLTVFLPGLDYVFIARLAPVALVLLGVELLVATLRHRGEKLRMDFLSILICLVLIGGSLVAAVVPQVLQRERQAEQAANRLSAQLAEEGYRALTQNGLQVSEVNWYVSLYNTTFAADITPGQLQPEHTVQVRVTLDGDYTGARAFADDVRLALDSLRPLVAHMDYASFYSYDRYADMDEDGDTQYALWLNGSYQIDDPGLKLESLVEVQGAGQMVA